MLKPDNDFYYIRLAELYYTHGGKSNIAPAINNILDTAINFTATGNVCS